MRCKYYTDAFACVSFTEKLFQSDLPAEDVFVACKIRTIPPLADLAKVDISSVPKSDFM